jgi:hypothetical protein
MPQKAKTPTDAERKLVQSMAAVGIPSDLIGQVIGVSGKTLRKHYRHELDLAVTKANTEVAGFLFNSAKKGNVSAQIFWLKCRAGWKEPAVDHNHRGAIGTYDLTKLSDDKLKELEAILGTAALVGGDPGGDSKA